MSDYLSAEHVCERLNVSRETQERLEAYVALLLKWQNAINLIGPGTIKDVWSRHIHDCGQLMPYIPLSTNTVVDLGSGAGLPGMVLAIMGQANITLIESDSRKCAFLREAARETNSDVNIIDSRIEEVKNMGADVVTARALAPLERLLDLSKSVTKPNTIYLFLKGKGLKNELTYLKNNWSMDVEVHPSATSPDGAILKMESVVHVRAAHD